MPEDWLARLRGVHELRLRRLETGQAGARATERGDGPGVREIHDRVVAAQRRALSHMRSEKAAAAEVLRRIEHDIDLEATRLRSES